MEEDLDNLDWINSRDMRKASSRPVAPPKVDEPISQIVGKKIFVNDMRLIKLIAKWKQEKTSGDDEADNFLNDGAKVEELRRTLNPEIYGSIQ